RRGFARLDAWLGRAASARSPGLGRASTIATHASSSQRPWRSEKSPTRVRRPISECFSLRPATHKFAKQRRLRLALFTTEDVHACAGCGPANLHPPPLRAVLVFNSDRRLIRPAKDVSHLTAPGRLLTHTGFN